MSGKKAIRFKSRRKLPAQIVISLLMLFLAYPGKAVLSEYGEYMKKDRSVYEKTDTSAFSLYNHSFDGGKSWVEFDD